MADQKISQLPTITGANMANNDKFVLVDTSGDATVATTRAEFFKSVPDVTFGDNDKAIFGAGSDLQIYHDGSDSYVKDAGAGYLNLLGTGRVVVGHPSNGHVYLNANYGGDVELLFNNSKKLETTSTGINVTGAVTVAGIYNSGIYNQTGDAQFWVTNVGEAVRIQQNTGNVGIGASSPTFKLDVAGNARASYFALRTNESAPAETSFIYRPATGTLAFGTASAERMRIDSDGNVGIGTDDPDRNLDVVSAENVLYGPTVRASEGVNHRLFNTTNATSRYAGITLASNNSAGTTSEFTLSNVSTSSNYQGVLTLQARTGASTYAERLRVDKSGNVSIGKTNVLISAVGIHFTPDGTVSATKDGAIPLVLNRVATGSNNPNGVIAQFKRETVTVGNISVSDGATAFNTSSDYRLKENVVELTSASERVNQLRPSRFNWISDDTNTVIDGFIAHEVATVVPEAITGAKDAMINEEYEVTPEVLDEDGNVTTEAVMGTRSVPDYQGIDQSKLVPLLTAALQEALAEIASLKTRVEALEG